MARESTLTRRSVPPNSHSCLLGRTGLKLRGNIIKLTGRTDIVRNSKASAPLWVGHLCRSARCVSGHSAALSRFDGAIINGLRYERRKTNTNAAFNIPCPTHFDFPMQSSCTILLLELKSYPFIGSLLNVKRLQLIPRLLVGNLKCFTTAEGCALCCPGAVMSQLRPPSLELQFDIAIEYISPSGSPRL